MTTKKEALLEQCREDDSPDEQITSSALKGNVIIHFPQPPQRTLAELSLEERVSVLAEMAADSWLRGIDRTPFTELPPEIRDLIQCQIKRTPVRIQPDDSALMERLGHEEWFKLALRRPVPEWAGQQAIQRYLDGEEPTIYMTAIPVRPGISEATLQKAGVSFDDYPHPDSIKIPYYSINGAPRTYTDLSGKTQQFARWRLSKLHETSEKKYHQPKGSPQFAYHLPVAIAIADILALLEGEFKFLSAYEEGLDGLGLPSFFVYTNQNGNRVLLPEITAAIKTVRPQKNSLFR